ncbi:MAG: helix-turn-helix domain-containing protein [Treponema sp.]|nr:helix-turn-helix domain-containing protein [Treponema sp.]
MGDPAVPFWERVNQLIKTRKTTQEDLAKSLGIPFGTYRGWNAYRRLPDVLSGLLIARALGTTVEHLVTGEEPGKPDVADAIRHLDTARDLLQKL